MTTSIPHKVSALRAAEQLDSTRDKLFLTACHLIPTLLPTLPPSPPLCSTSSYSPFHLSSAVQWCATPPLFRNAPSLHSTVLPRTSSSLYMLPSSALQLSPCMPPPQHCFPTSTSASDHPALITNKVAPPINPTISGFCVTLVLLPGSVPFLFKPVSTES